MEHLLWPALNLTGLLVFIFIKTKGPFLNFVKGRRSEIFDSFNRSKVQLEEAARRRKAAEARFATLDSERKKIEQEWKEREGEQIAALQEGSRRIIAQMKVEAEQNKKGLEESTRKAIQIHFKKTVLNSAEQRILQSLNPDSHKKVNERLIGDLNRGASAS